MDQARVVPGARRGFQAVTASLVREGDPVIVSALAHYTEFLAVEQVGGLVREVPLSPQNLVTADATAEKIEEVRRETGKTPALVMIDHFDYQFANEHDVREIAKVAHQYDIPFLYNGAYTVGVMPVDGKAIGADFVVGSGHKSMAAPAPSGVLATTDEYADRVFRTTGMVGDVTGRKFGIKEVEMLGCTLMGANLIAMMASFPAVRERTLHWSDEVEKSNYFLDHLLAIEGSRVLSEYPRKHSLSKVDTTGSFDTVAKTHKRKGFFLSDELSKRGIVGEFAGATRTWKLNTFGLTWKQIRYARGDLYRDRRETPDTDHTPGDIHDRERAARRGHPRPSCRADARPDDRLPRGADLPDDQLRLPRHRARGESLRPEGTREHLHAADEPHDRRLREADGRARGRDGRRCGRVGDGRHHYAALTVTELGDEIVAATTSTGGPTPSSQSRSPDSAGL